MATLLEKLFNLMLIFLAVFAISASILPLFGYQLFIFPIKFEAFQDLSFDYMRLLMLRSCVFLTMSIFLLNYSLYRRPYSALAPVAVFCYTISIFEFLSQFIIAKTTEYSSSPFVIVFWLLIGAILHYKNAMNAKTIFKN
jgi:hypothetical protein|tara:strand:+ start:4073 stop:4492 length:420 start_codon:yes stop_codon:yes gene_type:complete